MAGIKGRSGRRKGSKNLIRTDDGSIINEYGVTITPEEQRQLRNLNARITYQRKRAERQAAAARGGKPGEASFLYNPQQQRNEITFKPYKLGITPASVQSKQQLKTAIQRAQLDTSKLGKHLRIQTYKYNYLDAARKVATNNAAGAALVSEISELLNKVNDNDFMRLSASGELPSINYIYYDPDNSKLQKVRNVLIRNITTPEAAYNDVF